MPRDIPAEPTTTTAPARVPTLARLEAPAEAGTEDKERVRSLHTAEAPAASCAANFVLRNASQTEAWSLDRRHIMRPSAPRHKCAARRSLSGSCDSSVRAMRFDDFIQPDPGTAGQAQRTFSTKPRVPEYQTSQACCFRVSLTYNRPTGVAYAYPIHRPSGESRRDGGSAEAQFALSVLSPVSTPRG